MIHEHLQPQTMRLSGWLQSDSHACGLYARVSHLSADLEPNPFHIWNTVLRITRRRLA